MKNDNKKVGLILSGGGARAAYQVGVLKAISEILPKDARLPYDIICGTSAGGLNAAALAVHSVHYRTGIRALDKLWRNIASEQIYKTNLASLLFSVLRSGVVGLFGGQPLRPSALLDNEPLRDLLSVAVNFKKITRSINEGYLDVLSISASDYDTGDSVTFYQGHNGLKPWRIRRRVGKSTKLSVKHLMASTAIPFVFPAEKIDEHYFGDGAIRQISPLSPALTFGADKIMVIGVSDEIDVGDSISKTSKPPSFAQTLGHVLNSAFIGNFEGDIERLERINNTLKHIPDELKKEYLSLIPYKQIEVLKIFPSKRLDKISAKHRECLPTTMKLFLRGSGATTKRGASALSLLLFEPGYTVELMDLGYADAMTKKEEIKHFFNQVPTRDGA